MTYSSWGNIYDHGIDLIHPPFWYWAWFIGLGGAYSLSEPLFGICRRSRDRGFIHAPARISYTCLDTLQFRAALLHCAKKSKYVYYDGRNSAYSNLGQCWILGVLIDRTVDLDMYRCKFPDFDCGVFRKTPNFQLDGYLNYAALCRF